MSLINREDAIEVIESMTVTLGGKEIFGPNVKQSVIDVRQLEAQSDTSRKAEEGSDVGKED